MQSPPESNLTIFKVLYNVENALRELIVHLLESVAGPHWYASRLPGDILEKYREGIGVERSTKWTQLVPHHPIYYVDFSDLRKIIERNDNWIDAFEKVFKRKDLISSMLSELEFIRNRVAHNRKSSEKDVEIAQSIYTKLASAVGPSKFEEFTARSSLALDIKTLLTTLTREMDHTLRALKDFKPVGNVSVWKEIHKKWWFDETYLGHRLDAIRSYFELVIEYQALPRGRGTGHIIEKWVSKSALDAKFSAAKAAMNQIVIDWESL